MAALGSWEKSRIHQMLRAIGTYVTSVQAGDGITVDSTDPKSPIVSSKISTSIGNAITVGVDGGLFVSSSGGADVPTIRKIAALRAF